MRTLKKTLALVLVVAMALSFGVIGANAAFTDVTDATDYATAIDTLTGLGVINGMPDGTFDPTGSLTREQAAKIVCYIVLGPTNAELVSQASAKVFDDVAADRWSAGYIEYCYNTGIIAGVGDNNFDPTGTLTTAAFTKMVLCALGYDAGTAGLTGSSWAINTAALAVDAGIAEDGIVLSASITIARAEACQIAFNALGADCVKYTGGSTITVGDTTIIQGATLTPTGKTGLETWFSGHIAYGIITANQATGASYTYVDTATFDSVTGKITTFANSPVAYDFDSGLSDLGQIVKIYYKTTAKVLYADVISSIVTVSTVISSSPAKYAAAFGSVSTGFAGDIYTYDSVYAATYMGTPSIGSFSVGASAPVGTYAMYRGQIVSYKVATTATLEKVKAISTTVGAESITLSSSNGGAAISNTAFVDNIIEYDGIAKGDYVIVTAVGSKYSVEKATAVDATLTSLAYNASTTVYTATAGGVSYTASTYVTDTLGLAAISALVAGENYTFYLDADGDLIAAYGITAATTNYSYVAQFGEVNTYDALGNVVATTLSADIYFADGTHAVYPIDVTTVGTTFNGATYSNATTTSAGSIGLYNVRISGTGKAIINAIADTSMPAASDTSAAIDLGEVSITKGISKIGADTDSTGGNVYATSNSVVFYVTGTYGVTSGASAYSVTVLTGIANIATGTTLTEGYYDATGTNKLFTAGLSGAVPSTSSADVMFYNGGYSETTALVNGSVVTTCNYTVYVDGVAQTVSFTENTSFSAVVTAPGFYVVGTSNLAAPSGTATWSADARTVTGLYGGTLSITTDGDMQLPDTATIVDLTPSTQTYTDLTTGTVTVWVDWTVNAYGTKTVDTVYVTAVA